MQHIPLWIDEQLPLIPSLLNISVWLKKKEHHETIRNTLGIRILYAQNKQYTKTALSLLYIHGYSSSVHETSPLLDILSRDLGVNAVAVLGARHGISLAPMEYLTAEDWYFSALEGVSIAKALGDKVIIISCSTGGTIGFLLSARNTAHEEITSHIALSPNCWPYPKLLCTMFLYPMLIPLLYASSYCTKSRGPYRIVTAKHELQAQVNTLKTPLSAVSPMMHLIKYMWNVLKYHPSRYSIPAHIIASPKDREVIFAMTKKFITQYPAPATLDIFTECDSNSFHVPAGDVSSPSTTANIAARIKRLLAPYI